MTCVVFPFLLPFFFFPSRLLQLITPWNGAETLELTKVQKPKNACRLILSLGREITCPRPSGASDTHVHQIRQSHV